MHDAMVVYDALEDGRVAVHTTTFGVAALDALGMPPTVESQTCAAAVCAIAAGAIAAATDYDYYDYWCCSYSVLLALPPVRAFFA